MKNELTPKIGLCLSGGGSRAMAFHLGCLRALHKHSILNEISLISTVSGGSVIGALYAYSDDSFEEFTLRVTQQLEQGFQDKEGLDFYLSNLGVGNGAKAIGRALWSCVPYVDKEKNKRKILQHLEKIFSPVEGLVAVFDERMYQGKKLSAETRDGIEIIINACELSTNTAFRLGNRVISNWVLGKVSADALSLAEAVAASAAHPAYLATMNKQFEFHQDGTSEKKKVFLTDGGVYESLGVTALLPDRLAAYSYPHYNFDYIIACDADDSRPSSERYGMTFLAKIAGSIATLMRRVRSMNFKLLHEYERNGDIKGFVLACLGGRDEEIFDKDDQYVPYEQIADYPTDFMAMSRENIDLLARRGEQITAKLVKRYLHHHRSGSFDGEALTIKKSNNITTYY